MQRLRMFVGNLRGLGTGVWNMGWMGGILQSIHWYQVKKAFSLMKESKIPKCGRQNEVDNAGLV
jgi:hypothetical protein